MGLPTGYVTSSAYPRSAELRALGNGVVPQQAECALGELLARISPDECDLGVTSQSGNPAFMTVQYEREYELAP